MAYLLALEPCETTQIPDEESLTDLVRQLYKLLQQLHSSLFEVAVEAQQPSLEHQPTLPSHTVNPTPDGKPKPTPPGKALVEPFFYSGTGAYDMQFLSMALDKYQFDADWMSSNVRISIPRLVRVAKRLQRLQDRRFLSHLQASDHQERCRTALRTFCFSRDDLHFLTDDEFAAFIANFAVTPGAVLDGLTSVGQVNEIEYKPIMQLDAETFFLPVGFKLTEAIYESPSYWMRKDLSYFEQASSNRGRATEQIAAQILTRVFGEHVYKNVHVWNGKHEVAEIDVLVLQQDRALIVQAKSKGLTALSRQGDDKQIQEDFQKAIQEAYEQGLACKQALLGYGYDYWDGDGNRIQFQLPIEDAYIVCLTLSPFPVLTKMLDTFLFKASNDPYPAAMSAFDLDIVATYIDNPIEFLHYIRYRVDSPEQIHGHSEVDLLSSYLNLGLFVPKHVDAAYLTADWAELIDEDYPRLRGRTLFLKRCWNLVLPSYPNPLLVNSEEQNDSAYAKLRVRKNNKNLNHFKNLLWLGPDMMPTEAHFMLHDLSTQAVEEFLDKALKMKQQCKDTKLVTSCSIRTSRGDGISYVCFPKDHPVLLGHIQVSVEAWKHKAKADKWLGFVGVSSRPEIADKAAFLREPWVPDPEMDKNARELLLGDTELKKLGRNDPCWCTSGLKFKRCHGVAPPNPPTP